MLLVNGLFIVFVAFSYTDANILQTEQNTLQDLDPTVLRQERIDKLDPGDSTIMRELLWSMDVSGLAGPTVNSTSHLIFNTASSLLLRWPNTRYRNGHTIIPATIPVGTQLYHGTSIKEIPTGPEWVATDPEHSYAFCRSKDYAPEPNPFPGPNSSSTSGNVSGCWHLTLVTTKPLKLLYFDGSSAIKIAGGPIDTQDLITWGKIAPEMVREEQERITRLCRWGQKYGIDGFLRMSMDFEIMLCSFHAKVEPISFVNLVSIDSTFPPNSSGQLQHVFVASRTNDTDDKPLMPSSLFRILESGSWYNTVQDTRIKLDYSRLISFYDSSLFPSLLETHFNKPRLDHNLAAIDSVDVIAFRKRLHEILQNDYSGSGVDWQSILRTITNTYADRLEILHYILNNATLTDGNEANANATLKQAHRHISDMLVSYVLLSTVKEHQILRTKGNTIASSTSARANEDNRYSWALPVFKLCSSRHVQYIEEKLYDKLTYSEVVLLNSMIDVSKEICRLLVSLWAEGVESGLGPNFPEQLATPHLKNRPENKEASPLIQVKAWAKKTEAVMRWLDWTHHWVKCRPACDYEEMCYLPTFPFFFKTDWINPQPRCIRRVEPLDLEDPH